MKLCAHKALARAAWRGRREAGPLPLALTRTDFWLDPVDKAMLFRVWEYDPLEIPR
jgi:hypothetical protein